MGAAQFIILAWFFLVTGVALAKHGDLLRVNFFSQFIVTALTIAVLFWGGFFA
jgi:uncharacterized membrane protein YozB (DUF420 family)